MSAPVLTTHTKAPWAWYRAGKEWLLWGEHGRRPIVLSLVRGRLSVRDEHELMVSFDPKHPDAVLIAAAPALFEALRDLLDWDRLGDAGYCEMCEAHAPKDPIDGSLNGPLVHAEGCTVGIARAALAEASPS